MKNFNKFLSLILCGQLVFSLSANANCTRTHSLAKENKDSTSAPSSDLSALEIFTLDMEDVFDLIDNGEKKTALVILKSAQKQIRKIKEFTVDEKNDFSNKIKQIIKLVKKGNNEEALDLVDKILSALDDSFTDEDDKEIDDDEDF